MRVIGKVLLAGAGLIVMTNGAYAYDFGFVRAPDWMDPYVLGLLLLQIPFFLGLMVTKPSSVPFNQLYRADLPPMARFFHRAWGAIFVVFMIFVFVGMGLARA
ncbi:hypothetical protein [Pseudaestuariivita rosea]|uniref:hypothetical protein n=1 Tax=Pseudaestuariivita rosea TaxID=2763263 RepID=UPI001ABA6088|nr:hypothetical protein [Pseudaestuariivita rosea]